MVPNRRLERTLWQQGHGVVVGIDEVGRGCAAGPVTVGAVVLPERFTSLGIRDSKFLSPAAREKAAKRIRRQAIAVGLGWASSAEIDALGLTAALRLAAVRAIKQLGFEKAAIILDGTHNYLGSEHMVTNRAKADQSCLPVAAASIVAKVARDRYMQLLDYSQPAYGFGAHKGYGTFAHLAALQEFGPSSYHRRMWRSVRELAIVN